MIRQDIISQVTESLKRGESTEEAFVQYIYRGMLFNSNSQATMMPYGPTPYGVWDKLKENDVFCKDDISLICTNVIDGVFYMRLTVRIHPSLTLTVENYDGLTVTVNGCSKVKN